MLLSWFYKSENILNIPLKSSEDNEFLTFFTIFHIQFSCGNFLTFGITKLICGSENSGSEWWSDGEEGVRQFIWMPARKLLFCLVTNKNQ